MDPTTNNKQQVLGSNKIRQIVRLQQLLKKWKRIAAASPSSTHLQLNNSSSSSINKFLKKTLSFSEKDRSSSDEPVPKGCLAVCVGKEEEKKRFVIPMDYLAHQSFQVLLREAEEEFGFQQQGVLKIPCQVSLFHNILKTIQSSSSSNKTQPPEPAADHDDDNNTILHNVGCCSPDNHQHMTERPSSASFILIN